GVPGGFLIVPDEPHNLVGQGLYLAPGESQPLEPPDCRRIIGIAARDYFLHTALADQFHYRQTPAMEGLGIFSHLGERLHDRLDCAAWREGKAAKAHNLAVNLAGYGLDAVGQRPVHDVGKVRRDRWPDDDLGHLYAVNPSP